MKIAIAGNPNCGKTTIFNALTGANQHVGNYPGVTVEKVEGHFYFEQKKYSVIDLPGTYGLTAYSEDELVAREFIVNEFPDLIINIVDSSNLERNLYLTTQFMEMGIPMVLVLNMIDVAHKRGIIIDSKELSRLLGIPVVELNGRSQLGLVNLKLTISEYKPTNHFIDHTRISYGTEIDEKIKDIVSIIQKDDFQAIPTIPKYYPCWLAIKLVEQDEKVTNFFKNHLNPSVVNIFEQIDKLSKHIELTLDDSLENIISSYRYGFIVSLLKTCTQKKTDIQKDISKKIDLILLHKFFGPIILLTILWYFYQIVFSISEYPVELLESLFGKLSLFVENIVPEGMIQSLITSGIIDGVGGVLGFTPLIVLMFFIIAIIEDTGYMTRMAYILDRILRTFGMHGNSILAFIVSGGIAGGCAVPGIMATRTLRDPKERLATILTAPFMNCGAKLPVFALLIGTFFSEHKGAMMFAVTLMAWSFALFIAGFLRKTILKGEPTPFIMELPPYRLPTLKGLIIHTWQRTWMYIKKAGTTILAISILIWGLMSFPTIDEAKNINLSEGELSALKLESSVAGFMGKKLETITQPLMGFDWKTNISLIAGLAAKELVVSTLGTAHSLTEVEDDTSSLSEKLSSDPNWNPLKAFTLIIFILLYMPCVATVAVIKKETNSWKWATFSIVYTTLTAIVFATIVYQVGQLFS